MQKAIKIISRSLFIVTTLLLIYVFYRLLVLGILPMRYVLFGGLIVLQLMVANGLIAFFKKQRNPLRIILIIIDLLLVVASFFGLYYIKHGAKFVTQITVEEDVPVNHEFDITKDSFNIYLSGLDDGDRSDVNMLLSINPRTGKILITGIPRDYYVPFHNTGEKDKLTHSGYYMGATVKNTMETVADFMELDIDYYIQVDFESVLTIVDLIGGVDFYSDKTFSASGCYFVEGQNHADGKCALVFSRQRKVYTSGESIQDLHRIENQGVIMEAILNKLSSPSLFVQYYEELLEVSAEVIRTNLPEKSLYQFINYELDQFPDWQFERTRLDGTHLFNVPSPTLDGELVTVIDPDWDSVAETREKIEALLAE